MQVLILTQKTDFATSITKTKTEGKLEVKTRNDALENHLKNLMDDLKKENSKGFIEIRAQNADE